MAWQAQCGCVRLAARLHLHHAPWQAACSACTHMHDRRGAHALCAHVQVMQEGEEGTHAGVQPGLQQKPPPQAAHQQQQPRDPSQPVVVPQSGAAGAAEAQAPGAVATGSDPSIQLVATAAAAASALSSPPPGSGDLEWDAYDLLDAAVAAPDFLNFRPSVTAAAVLYTTRECAHAQPSPCTLACLPCPALPCPAAEHLAPDMQP